jgi:GNAT superfamily N-acetyltransferase
MRPVHIRSATPADMPGVRACLEAAFAPYRQDYTPDAYADTVPGAPRLAERFATMSVVVAEGPDGTVVGTLSYAATGGGADGGPGGVEGHLRGMAVLPAVAGSGVAAALLAAAEDALRSRGCVRVTLDTTAPLQRAMRFYERHGYRRSGRVADFYGMPLHELTKTLEPRGALGR